jgi:hypothetical protein
MSVRLILLCEDQQLACFARRFLKRRGWNAHDIREEIAPAGEGSGEQWVRERFPDELMSIRKRQGSALIVCTDADTGTVEERTATLYQICTDKKIPVPTPQDAVAMIVPKRNIETWFAYLRGETINENDTYRRYTKERECQPDVNALDEMCLQSKLREPAPASLTAACQQAQKIPRR